MNDSRVVPGRIPIERPRGEVLLLERLGRRRVGGARAADPQAARRAALPGRLGSVELVAHLGEGRWRVRLEGEPAGAVPLPPYITTPLADPERYQTVYAREPGSAAAPTAGLHFTSELLGLVDSERVTLHVGLDTFRPLQAARVEEHRIHGERYEVTPAAWRADRRRGERCWPSARRRCEWWRRSPTAGRSRGAPSSSSRPGFEFRRVDHLLTNFHLPRSTLLALVMAFAGVEETRRLYALAIEERYRFYSFGDAMLIL